MLVVGGVICNDGGVDMEEGIATVGDTMCVGVYSPCVAGVGCMLAVDIAVITDGLLVVVVSSRRDSAVGSVLDPVKRVGVCGVGIDVGEVTGGVMSSSVLSIKEFDDISPDSLLFSTPSSSVFSTQLKATYNA